MVQSEEYTTCTQEEQCLKKRVGEEMEHTGTWAILRTCHCETDKHVA
jgi:hypothetical protein